MPTYDGIGSSITHRVEVAGDSLFQDVDGGTLSTKVPVQIFSNYYASPGSVDSSRQLRFRVQPDGESNVSNSYVTDMGVKGADGSNYFFITAPQNTSNVGDQNTFVISTTSNVGIGTTDPTKTLEVVGDIKCQTLSASTITGASPLVIDSDETITINAPIAMPSDAPMSIGTMTVSNIFHSDQLTMSAHVAMGSDKTLTTSNIVANTGDNLLVNSNLEVGTSNLFVDTATGRVGINTTNPIDDLHVRGGITFQYGDSINATTDSQSWWTNNKVLSAGWNGTYDTTQLWVPGGSSASTPRITILSNGNVGIGTASPTNTLDINEVGTTRTGTHATGRPLYVTGDIGEASDGFEIRHSNGTQGIGFGYNSIYAAGTTTNQNINIIPKGSSRVRISNSGNLTNYIDIASYMNDGSTRSISGLHFLANPQFYNGDNGQRSAAFIRSGFYNSYWDSYISFITRTQASNGGEVETLTCKSGNVGVNTASPGAKLDIKASPLNHIGLLGSSSGRYIISTDANGVNMYFTHGSYSWGVWANAHHYDVYSASNFTGNRDLFLNFYSGGIVRLANYAVVTSDDRIKTNERYIENATETLLKLKPQIYDKGPSVGGGGKTRVESGLIVQDVYYDAPELRHLIHHDEDAEIPDEKPFVDDDPQNDPDYSMWGSKSPGLYYEGFIAYLIKSNQEQQALIESLEARIEALENSS